MSCDCAAGKKPSSPQKSQVVVLIRRVWEHVAGGLGLQPAAGFAPLHPHEHRVRGAEADAHVARSGLDPDQRAGVVPGEGAHFAPLRVEAVPLGHVPGNGPQNRRRGHGSGAQFRGQIVGAHLKKSRNGF